MARAFEIRKNMIINIHTRYEIQNIEIKILCGLLIHDIYKILIFNDEFQL